jgi:hypothetical protein
LSQKQPKKAHKTANISNFTRAPQEKLLGGWMSAAEPEDQHTMVASGRRSELPEAAHTNFILKSLVIIVEQCENIFCIMFFRIKLKCDIYILGGLYIVIIYKFFSCVIKKCGDEFNTKIYDCCAFCQ